MKIMAFSDLHMSRKRAAELVAASADADLVIGAGDFCNMRQGLEQAMGMLAGLAVPAMKASMSCATPRRPAPPCCTGLDARLTASRSTASAMEFPSRRSGRGPAT